MLPLYYFILYSAGIGVVNAASRTMARMLGNNEVAFESARSQFWIVDALVSWITKDHLTIAYYFILSIPSPFIFGMVTLSRKKG
jgi:hypothetical protein